MDSKLRLPKGVKRVTFLRADGASDGPAEALEVVEARPRKTKSKKQSPELRVFGKLTRRSSKAVLAMADTYLERHERSNAKHRDGWFRDIVHNVSKANNAGLKKLRIPFFRF